MKNNNTTDGLCLMFTYHSLSANNDKCLQVVDYYKKVINPNVYVPQIFELRMANDLSEGELADLSAQRHREYQNYISDKSLNGNFIFFDENEYEAFTAEYWVFEKDMQLNNGKALAFYFNDNINNGGFTLIQTKTPVTNMPVYGNQLFPTSTFDDSQKIVDIVVKVMKELISEYPNLCFDMNMKAAPVDDKNDIHKISEPVDKVVETKKEHATKEEIVWVSAHLLAARFNCSLQSIYERANHKDLPHIKYGNKKTSFKFDLKKAERYFKKYPLSRHEKYRP
jgi:hypothetical protein